MINLLYCYLSKVVTAFAVLCFSICLLNAQSYQLKEEFDAFMLQNPKLCEKLLVCGKTAEYPFCEIVSKKELPKFFAMINQLANKMNVDAPEIVRIDFTYNDNACVSEEIDQKSVYMHIGSELLRNAIDDEIAGTIAHELAHIKLCHIIPRKSLVKRIIDASLTVGCIMGGAATISRYIGGDDDTKDVYRALLLSILATNCYAKFVRPTIKAFLSRRREKQADLESLKVLENPDVMIEEYRRLSEKQAQKSWWRRIFSTHPSYQERVIYLEAACAELKK